MIPPVARVGIVLPVHNEERLLAKALESLDEAIQHAAQSGVEFRTTIVLDSCSDRSFEVAKQWPPSTRILGDHQAEIIQLDAFNVGLARQVGCSVLLRKWFEVALDTIWLASTDADSEVPKNWLSSQLRLREAGVEVWAGTVTVNDWADRPVGMAEEWNRRYSAESLPIHGANLGIDAATYQRSGGFPGLVTGEDRALFERTIIEGAVVSCDPSVRVVTSGRREARAPDGLSQALTTLEQELQKRPSRKRPRCGELAEASNVA